MVSRSDVAARLGRKVGDGKPHYEYGVLRTYTGRGNHIACIMQKASCRLDLAGPDWLGSGLMAMMGKLGSFHAGGLLIDTWAFWCKQAMTDATGAPRVLEIALSALR